ncbi:MAG: FkbM family methyltransferase [Bacteroidota bacterium]
MKQTIKFVLQRLFGFENYLFIFSIFTIFTLKFNRKEKDFLFFLSLIPDEGTLIDIGANIGIMSYHFSKKRPHSSILCFEPVPVNAKILRKIVSFFRLSNVRVYEVALGNYSGTAEVIMPVMNSVRMQGLSYIRQQNPEENMPSGESFTCKIERLDESLSLIENPKKINALKIDVENHEWQVLEGAKNTLLKNKPFIYVELWENENRANCLRLLTELGYETFVVIKNSMVKFNSAEHNTQNFIFIPKKLS